MNYLIGVIGFCLGIVIIVYRERLKRITGDIPFAEKWFGLGGTYTALLIFGIIVSIGSIMYALGTFQLLLRSIFGPLFGTG